ncbi:virion morphogenesis protein, partial [Bacillus sp. SRB_336]
MLTITADDKVFRDSLAQLYRGMGNLTPVMQSIGMELESRISGRFESRTDPSGSAWAPWAQSTV